MRRTLSAIACASLLIAAAQEAETVNKSLVRVFAQKDGTMTVGTGFAIGDKGHVVTVDHVATAGVLRVVRAGDPVDAAYAKPAKVVYTNKERNLAILEVPGLGAWGLALSGTPAKQGMQVYLLGYPGGNVTSSTLSSGLVQKLVTKKIGGADVGFVQHEAKGGPGSGGGPLVNACGAVVGVNGFLLEGAVGLGVGVTEVMSVARANKIDFATAPACAK
jgi:S1-C subfamily serine protease